MRNMKLFKSRYLYCIPDGCNKYGIVYHTLFGNPRVFSQEALKILNIFDDGISLEEIKTIVDGNQEKAINELVEIYFLVPADLDERAILHHKREEYLARLRKKQTVDYIRLSVSDTCNFGCKHCMFFQPDKDTRVLPLFDKPAHQPKMSWEIAKNCIETYISLMREAGVTHGRIRFGNAEPLLNWPVMEKALMYCEEMPGFSFVYSISTNLSLLTEEIGKTLKRYKVKIGTSLDGLKEANDLIRITKSGKGTFSTIIEKIDLLEKIGYPLDEIGITVTSKNYNLVDTDIIDFAYQRGMNSVDFDYDLVNLVSIPVYDRVSKIMRLKRYANERNIDFDGTWYIPFRKLMTPSLLSRTHTFCDAVGGRAIVFNPDGSVKVCAYTTTQVGDITRFNELFTETGGLYQVVAKRLLGNNNYCEGCIIEGACGGQCYVTREVSDVTHGGLFEDMCTFYRDMTNALIQDYLSSLEDLKMGGTI